MEIPVSGKAPEIYDKLKSRLEQIRREGKIEQLQTVEYLDETHGVSAKGTGFQLEIHCKDQKVIVDLSLNFLLKPMRGKIEETLKKQISKALS